MQTYYIHPDNPQPRIIAQVAQALKEDQLLVCPDTHGYQLIMSLNAKSALEQAVRMANWADAPHYTLVCKNLSQLSQYVEIDNFAHRILKSQLGQGVDFTLLPTKSTPKKFHDNKTKTIAVRLATTPISQLIIDQLDEAYITLPITIDGQDISYGSSYEVEMAVENLVDGYINAGEIMQTKPTIVSLIDDEVQLIEQGDAIINF